MAVKYLPYGNGKKVSTRWHRVLTAADRAGVNFTLTSGHRTMAEQWELYRQNMQSPGVPKPGRPMTAYPSKDAPHIRVGRSNHALDVNSLDGGETRLERWIESQGAGIEWVNTVPGEAWHGEVSAEDLRRLYRKLRPPPKPKPRTRASGKAVNFIAEFEGLRLEAYRDAVGVWTIGYGHTGRDVRPGMKITKARARQLLRQDLRRFEQAVVKHVSADWRRDQKHFDALVSIAFNVGEGVLTPEEPLTSLGRALDRKVTGPNANKVADAIRLYDKAGGQTLPGLTRRRRAEARMFLTGNYSTN